MNKLVIGIPGPWQTRQEVLNAVAGADPSPRAPRFLVKGAHILDRTTKQVFRFELYGHDPAMVQAFANAGQERFSQEALARIGQHRLTVYLVCEQVPPTPPIDRLAPARGLLALGQLLLDAGGYGVKVEHAGVAHTAERWRHYAAQATVLALYDSFVTMVGGTDYSYTCGMHTFGLPDVSLTSAVPVEDAPYLLNGFNQYHLLESPPLADDAWFATSYCEPALKMSLQPYGYEPDSLLNNPYGRWHLDLPNQPPPWPTTQIPSEPRFMALRRDDPALLKSVVDARASLDWFLEHFRSPYEYGYYCVKIQLPDDDAQAYIWAMLVEVKANELLVQLFELPKEFVHHRSGQQLLVPKAEIYDWSINRNGTLIGGFSRRLQREHIPPAELQQFDLYSGAIAFAPLDDLPTGAAL